MKKRKTLILVLFLAALLVSLLSCKNLFLKNMLVEDENGNQSSGPYAPFVEGGASFILSSDKLDIKVTAVTSDDSPVVIEGCTETTVASGTETELHAKDTTVILKGKIIKLYCYKNQLAALNVKGCTALQYLDCIDNKLTTLNAQGLSALQVMYCSDNQLTALNAQDCVALRKLECDNNRLTALNVQGCTALEELACTSNQITVLNVQGLSALKELGCFGNQLTAEAFTQIFNDLPKLDAGYTGYCSLYTEKTGVTEGNCKDFTSTSAPQNLKDAFQNAKDVKHWKMYKVNTNGDDVEI